MGFRELEIVSMRTEEKHFTDPEADSLKSALAGAGG